MQPLPPSAVRTFASGDSLLVQFEARNGSTVQLSFALHERGLAAFARFLREREMAFATAFKPPQFATAGAPIQHIVDAWHKAPPQKPRSAAAELLAKTKRDEKAKALAERAARKAEAERFSSKPVKEQLDELTSLFSDPDFDF